MKVSRNNRKSFFACLTVVAIITFLACLVPMLGACKKTSNAPPVEKELTVENESKALLAETGTSVSYRQYGAKGDGVTDDFEAIIKTHEAANKNGWDVKADSGATYYIGDSQKTAIIKTNTDWRGAKFIIDDSKTDPNTKTNPNGAFNRDVMVFFVKTSLRTYDFKNNYPGGMTSIKKGQTTLDLGLEQTSVVILENANKRNFIRWGENADAGSTQEEVIRVDKNGKVDPATPILWNYDEITRISVHPIDESPLTIRGGEFTTIANQAERKYANYFKRGVHVTRSNTTVDGLTFYVKGEGETGAPYHGSLYVSRSSFVTVQNTAFTGHRAYNTIDTDGKKWPTRMGSYGLGSDRNVDFKILNCRQLNDIHDGTRYGIMSSNLCKNITVDGVHFSRFDAHRGVNNLTIRNSTFGFQGLSLIGSGEARIEKVRVEGQFFVWFRPDYGSTWDGDLIIKDCSFAPPVEKLNAAEIFHAENGGTHDFGYQCSLPKTVTIDGFKVEDSGAKKAIVLYNNFDQNHSGTTKFYPCLPTEKLFVRNFVTESGHIDNSSRHKNARGYPFRVLENRTPMRPENGKDMSETIQIDYAK